MSTTARLRLAFSFAAFFCVLTMSAQAPIAQAPLLYGDPISVEMAKKAAAAAIQNAEKNHLQMSVAIVDPDGELVYFERMNGNQIGSIKVAIEKARTAALYRRPTKVFEDAVAAGGVGLRVLTMPDIIALDGGFPIIVGGKVVGAIGASGGTSAQDGECALAGSSALK